MKKSLLLVLFLILFPLKVNAASVGISCPSTVTVGDTIECNITAYHSSLSGLVANISYSGMDYDSCTNNTGANYFSVSAKNLDGVFDIATSSKNIATYKFIASSKGTALFNVSNVVIVDGESFSEISGSGNTKTITINAKETEPNNNNNNNNNNNRTNNVSVKTTTTKAKISTTTTKPIGNTFLLSLTIDGLEINFDKNVLEYNLTVDNNTKKLAINAEPDDKNSKVSIKGNENLLIGDNKIEINVTASDNTNKTYILNIKREDLLSTVNNNIDEIKKALNQDQSKITVKVDINDQNKIVKTDILELLKKENKNIIFQVQKNNTIMYSFSLVGKNIKETTPINYNIEFNSKYGDNIKNIFKNNKYKIINFDYSGNLPKDTEVMIFDKELSNKVYLYYYNPNTNEAEYITNFKKNKNYIKFKIDHCSEYIISNKKSNDINNVKKIVLIIIVLEILIIFFIIFKCKIIKL